jgi:probable phosphoglycerate mutase
MGNSQKTRVYLIRHGATVLSAQDKFAGSSDVELSDEGRRQAGLLGKRLAAAQVDAVYCSNMKRALVTAEAVALPHGLVPTPLAELREIDHGQWEGLTHEQVQSRYGDEYAAWKADPLMSAPSGGETAWGVLARSLPAFLKVIQSHRGGKVAVVSHKATNRLLISFVLGLDLERYRDRLGQDLACLNVLDFVPPAEAQAIALNDTNHYQSLPE